MDSGFLFYDARQHLHSLQPLPEHHSEGEGEGEGEGGRGEEEEEERESEGDDEGLAASSGERGHGVFDKLTPLLPKLKAASHTFHGVARGIAGEVSGVLQRGGDQRPLSPRMHPSTFPKIHALSLKLQEHRSRIESARSRVEEVAKDYSAHRAHTSHRTSACEKALTEQEALLAKLCALSRDLDKRLERQHANVEELAKRQHQLADDVLTLQYLNVVTLPSHLQYTDNGREVFLWRVDDVQHHRQANSQLYSQLFCSHLFRYSFRIKARMDTNGFFGCGLNLCCGDYDDLAEWPFALVFTISVLDRNGAVAESDTMNAAQDSDAAKTHAFQRPTAHNDHARGWARALEWNQHNLGVLLLRNTLQLELVLRRPDE